MDVPQLTGAANYSEWHECLKLHLLGQGLWDTVSRGHAQPASEDSTDKAAIEKDQRARDILHKSIWWINQDLESLEAEGLSSAKKLYDYLKDKYEARESTKQSLAYANLIQLRYSGEGLLEFTRRHLTALSNCRKSGLVIDEKIQVYHLLAVLDRDFPEFTSARRDELRRDNLRLEWLINEIITPTIKEPTSYSLQYHGLPQEIIDLIFTYALCPPEGITVKVDKSSNIRSTQSFPVALLRLNRATHDNAKAIFYSKNTFTMDMGPKSILDFFMTLPKSLRQSIRTLNFKADIMGFAFYHNEIPDNLLSNFITEHMKVKSVSAFVEHDCYGDDKITTDSRVFYCLPASYLHAIKMGEDLKELRLVYSRTYDESISVYAGFKTIEISGDRLLTPLVRHEHNPLWYRHSRMSLEEKMTAVALNENTYRKAWHDYGLAIERDTKRRYGEEGTVLVVRPLEPSRKRSARKRRSIFVRAPKDSLEP